MLSTTRAWTARCGLLWLVLVAVCADADDIVEELVVYGRAQQQIGVAHSASEGMVGYDDLRLSPLLRVGELVESVPGMVATQHSGTGKANQYFLRGFNLDHGTDFAVAVDGVPINLRSHGHGQGYLDLNFLIADLVETSVYRKGPYAAQVGDFSSAGSVAFSYYDRLDEALLQGVMGADGYRRGVAAGSRDVGDAVLTGAIDVTVYDGPWQIDEDLEQNKAYLAYAFDVGGGRARVAAQFYESTWNATDQIPRRAVRSGQIDRLGFIDPDLAGDTHRYALSAEVDFARFDVGAYVVDYELSLFSNFTYLLDDPVDGDEFEQRDRRTQSGAWVDGEFAIDPGRPTVIRWGADLRYDDVNEVGLYGTVAQNRIRTAREDRVAELSMSAWGETEVAITDRLRAILGVRADRYDWHVNAVEPINGGSGREALVSPKFSSAWHFADGWEAYLSWGKGFHSNDVRGATLRVDPVSGDPADPVDVLVESVGEEIGLRWEAGPSFNATLVGFRLRLDSELLYVGDAGTTEPNDSTERVGAEATAFWQATTAIALHAAYTVTDARFEEDQGGGKDIPGAIERTFVAGVNGAWSNGLSASARIRHLGEAPLIEDGSVETNGSWVVNGGLGYRRGGLEYRLDVFNLLDSNDDDVSYFYTSRLEGEPSEGVADVHFHPMEPRTVRASVALRW